MVGFDTLTIEDATERLIDYRGKTPPKTASGVRLVTAKVVKGGQIHDEPAEYIAADFYDEWMRRGLPQKLDVLLTTEAPLGEVAILRDDERIALAQRIILLRAKADLLDPTYLFYALQSDFCQGELKARASGTTVLGIKQSELRRVRIPVFALPIQRRIAGILSAYDELIENSQRRIKILESMARALYREWFVHFRFPGHESVPRIPSPLGPIPQGWEVKSIANICDSVSYGYTASASREEVGPKFLRITDIVPATIDWAGVPFCEITPDRASKYLLECGDIVVARTGATTGYAKRLNKLHPDTVFASYLVRVRAKVDVSNLMLGIVMESDEYKQFIQTNMGGAAQPQANAAVLTSMRLAVPPSCIGLSFDRLVVPMIDEAELLAVKVQNLRRTRDLLLPRLLSGQIEVQDIDA